MFLSISLKTENQFSKNQNVNYNLFERYSRYMLHMQFQCNRTYWNITVNSPEITLNNNIHFTKKICFFQITLPKIGNFNWIFISWKCLKLAFDSCCSWIVRNSRKFITENVEFHLENSLNETTHINRIANHISNSGQSIMNTLNELLLFEILHQCGNTRYAGLIHQNKSIQIFTQYAKHCKMCFKFMSLKRI